LLLLIWFSAVAFCSGQDSSVTAKGDDAFANFLYSSKLYDLAAEEYERLLFYDPDRITLLDKLIKCYTYTGQDHLVDRRFDLINTQDKKIAQSYYDLLLQIGKPDKFKNLYEQQKTLFTQDEQKEIEFKLAVAHYDWESVRSYVPAQDNKYEGIIQKVKETSFKKPGLAATLYN